EDREKARPARSLDPLPSIRGSLCLGVVGVGVVGVVGAGGGVDVGVVGVAIAAGGVVLVGVGLRRRGVRGGVVPVGRRVRAGGRLRVVVGVVTVEVGVVGGDAVAAVVVGVVGVGVGSGQGVDRRAVVGRRLRGRGDLLGEGLRVAAHEVPVAAVDGGDG